MVFTKEELRVLFNESIKAAELGNYEKSVNLAPLSFNTKFAINRIESDDNMAQVLRYSDYDEAVELAKNTNGEYSCRYANVDSTSLSNIKEVSQEFAENDNAKKAIADGILPADYISATSKLVKQMMLEANLNNASEKIISEQEALELLNDMDSAINKDTPSFYSKILQVDGDAIIENKKKESNAVQPACSVTNMYISDENDDQYVNVSGLIDNSANYSLTHFTKNRLYGSTMSQMPLDREFAEYDSDKNRKDFKYLVYDFKSIGMSDKHDSYSMDAKIDNEQTLAVHNRSNEIKESLSGVLNDLKNSQKLSFEPDDFTVSEYLSKKQAEPVKIDENTNQTEVMVSYTDRQLLKDPQGNPNGALIIPQRNYSMKDCDELKTIGGPEGAAYLLNTPKTDATGKTRYNHSIAVSEEQLQKMIAAAGDNKIVEGNKTTITFNADLTKAKDGIEGNTMIDMSKPLHPSNYKLTAESIRMQGINAEQIWKQDKEKTEVLVSYTDKQLLQDGKGNSNGAYVTAKLNQSMMSDADIQNNKALANPYLINVHTTDNNGQSVCRHSIPISENQLQKMIAAAGDNKVVDKYGTTTLAFKADLTKAQGKNANFLIENGRIPNTAHYMGKSDYVLTPESLAKHDEVTKRAKEKERWDYSDKSDLLKSSDKHEIHIKFSEKQLIKDADGKPDGAYIIPQQRAEPANINLINEHGQYNKTKHSVKISEEELQSFIKAAGDNKVVDKYGITTLGIKASLTPVRYNHENQPVDLMPDVKTAEKSDYRVSENISPKQYRKAQLTAITSMSVPQISDTDVHQKN